MQGFVVRCGDQFKTLREGWTNDVLEAVRFARKEDAEKHLDAPDEYVVPIEQCQPGFGISCTVAWTELHQAIIADGVDITLGKCGPKVRKWIVQMVAQTFGAEIAKPTEPSTLPGFEQIDPALPVTERMHRMAKQAWHCSNSGVTGMHGENDVQLREMMRRLAEHLSRCELDLAVQP